MESFLPIIQFLLPEFILENFELTSIDPQDGVFQVHIEEKNADEQDPERKNLLSKGFFPIITVQDFPIRGHQVFLHIKRRRWLNTKTGKVVYRDWAQVADGTRMTSEFAAFLKDISRLVAFMELMALLYCANTVIFRVALPIGLNDPAKEWLLYPQNLGPQLSLDETSLSHGELYTILINKSAKGGKVGPPMRQHRGHCRRD